MTQVSLVLLVALSTFLSVHAEMTAEEMQFVGMNTASVFGNAEISRKFGDIFVGLHQAAGFQTMATAKIQSGIIKKQLRAGLETVEAIEEPESLEEIENNKDFEMLLELKSTEFFPTMMGMGGMGMGMGMGMPYGGYGAGAPVAGAGYGAPFGGYAGYGYGNGEQQQHHEGKQYTDKDMEDAERLSTVGKVTALKYFFIQILTTASDVEKGYWVNKMYQVVLPAQFTIYKVYKNYLSTFALSTAIQLHDIFTFEAYTDDFNDKFSSLTGKSSKLTESVAEVELYQKWFSLCFLRFSLLQINMIEQAMVTQAAAAAVPPVAPAAPAPAAGAPVAAPGAFVFLEEELKVEEKTEFFGAQTPQAMAMQFAYLSYYQQILKYYTLFAEMNMAQTGSYMANIRYRAFDMLTDKTDTNDEEGKKLRRQASDLEHGPLSYATSQWANLVQMRYMMEYWTLLMGMYSIPGAAEMSVAQRLNNPMSSIDLVQTGAQAQPQAN